MLYEVITQAGNPVQADRKHDGGRRQDGEKQQQGADGTHGIPGTGDVSILAARAGRTVRIATQDGQPRGLAVARKSQRGLLVADRDGARQGVHAHPRAAAALRKAQLGTGSVLALALRLRPEAVLDVAAEGLELELAVDRLGETSYNFV